MFMIDVTLHALCKIILFFLLLGTTELCTSKYPNSVYLPVNHTITDEPAIVSLRIINVHICSGAIVSTQHIVTSAYCVCHLDKIALKYLKIVIGVSTTKEKGTELTVKNIICHPSKNSNSAFHQPNLVNIALIEAEEGILFGPKHRIAKLPFFNEVPTSKNYCYFLGWNSTQYSVKHDYPLQAIYLEERSQRSCINALDMYYSAEFINEHYFCAVKEPFALAHMQDPRQAVATYEWLEFGAPYYCDDMLLGIMHFPYLIPKSHKLDKILYSITKIQPLFKFFKDVIPEYTPIEA